MSQIKLKHSGGNSVIIAAPDSNPASDRTLKLPSDADGTILTTNSATGKILQVQSTTKTDFASQALTGSSNFFDISGMSVAITPSNTNNKIFVMFTVAVACNNNFQNNFIQLRRDSTDIAKGTAGGTVNASFYDKTRDNFSPENISVHFLDSPSTTSAVTYKVRWSGENGDTYYLNRNSSNTNEGMISSITVMEVAA
tara:strand:+ start:2154 stop:2744 length:591 start_codon:yes stop_codon:yes gene_type:complete